MKTVSCIVVGCAVMLFLGGCQRNETSLTPPTGHLPDQIIQDFELTETDGEEVVWKLTADKADIYNSEHKAVIDVVRVDFYEEGVYTSTLTADEGEVDTITNDMTAKGHVVITSKKENAILKTDELKWESSTGLIVSESPVTLERGDGIIKGQGFVATPGLSDFKTKNMEAVIPEEEMNEFSEEADSPDTEIK